MMDEQRQQSTYQVLVDSDDACVLSSYEPVSKDEASRRSEAVLKRRGGGRLAASA